jgi:probable HAF family extracellular repeat protein
MVCRRAHAFAHSVLAALAVLLLSGSRGHADAIRYTVTDLNSGALSGGSGGEAFGINASGQVVGTYVVNSQPRSFLYSGGKLTDTTSSGATGLGINNAGQMTKGGDNGINNVGQTIGMDYSPSTKTYQPYVSNNGVKTYLPFDSQPFAINDRGQVAGVFGPKDGVNHPFLYTNGQVIDLGLVSPGLNFDTKATAINNHGQVVGGALRGLANAFLYNGSKVIDLGTLGGSWSTAQGINNFGQVVGMSALQAPPGDMNGLHAFLYQNGSMLDLNALIHLNTGWVLRSANAINDSGQIVGEGVHDGVGSAFLLTPEVPEPSFLALIVLGAAMIGARRAAARFGSKR